MELTDGKDLFVAVQNAPIGICILNAESLVTEMVNDKFIEVVGKPYEAIYGKNYWEPFAEAGAYYEKALAGVVETGKAFYADEVEMMLIRHGMEELIFVTFVYAPIKAEDGRVSKIAVWVLENTRQVAERQQVEADRKAFQQERDRLKRYFMQAPAGICILDGPELVYEMVNPAYQKLLPDRELVGRPIFQALPELIGTSLEKILKEVYATGETYQIDDLLVPLAAMEGGTPIDRYFNFSYQARRDERNLVDGILVFAFEVTGLVEVQRKLEEANLLADQQKRIQETITSGTPDLMYVFGLDYRFTYANRALLAMWGKSREEAIGKNLLENGYEPWHAEMHEREIDAVVATRKSIRGEVSFPHAELGKRVYDYIFTPVIGDSGEVEAVAGTTRDVTDYNHSQKMLAKNAEDLRTLNDGMSTLNEELAASNEELSAINEELAIVNSHLSQARGKLEDGEIALRLAIDAANFGTWFIHSVTREFVTDKRLKELFGYFPDQDLSIEQALAQITDDYRGYVADKLEQAIYHHGDYDVTYPVIGLNDNRLRWLRAIGNLKQDPSGAFSAFTGVVMDITEQQLAAQKIEMAEEGLRMALESGELAIWHLDSSLTEIMASPRFNVIFGLAADEKVSFQSILAQVHPDYRQRVETAIADTFSLGSDLKLEFAITSPDDQKSRWVRCIGKLVRNADISDYITGVIADITEQKTDEIRKNYFIGMVSHELKTPLTSLKGYLQMLLVRQQKVGDERTMGMLTRSNQQVLKMTNMVNGFLNVSRLESGKLQIIQQRFDMAELIEEVKNEFLATSTSHQLAFDPVDKCIISADRTKIEHVIHNLISNAIKYSASGTMVRVICVQNGEDVQVSVVDQGMGIAEVDLPNIFDRYYRAKGQQMFMISGFGIGLYLCREIILAHHGEIQVESKLGEGAIFKFRLPLLTED